MSSRYETIGAIMVAWLSLITAVLSVCTSLALLSVGSKQCHSGLQCRTNFVSMSSDITAGTIIGGGRIGSFLYEGK
jgi:hypothetical protein